MGTMSIDPRVGAAFKEAVERSRAEPFKDPVRAIAVALARATEAAHAKDRLVLSSAWAVVAGMALAQAEASLADGVQVFEGYGEPPPAGPVLTPAQQAIEALARQMWEERRFP